jgi:ketosteroid isomerase-like protein
MKSNETKKAKNPEDLAKIFRVKATAGDAAGLADLYEPNATLVIDKNGNTVTGKESIKKFYEQLLKTNPKFESVVQRPTLKNGNLALTSAKLGDGRVTAEVARLQDDNTWLWAIDQPAIAMEKE